VNTGLLMDCGSEFVNMDNFTGLTSVNDSNYVNINTWRSVYASLYTAKFNNNINLTDFPTFNATLKAAISNTLPVPLTVLNYNYQVLRDDALTANLMYAINEQLYDVPNRTQSPYLTKTAFAIASAKDYIKAINGYVSFTFKSSLMFGNTGKTISTLKINLGDGQGWRTVQVDVPFNTQYNSTGFKIFDYEVTYTDNSIYQGHSRVYIKYEQESFTPGGGLSQVYRELSNPTISVNTPNGQRNATLQVWLSQQHSTNAIEKPLIVVEGIDFWRITDPNDAEENTDIGDFFNNTTLRPLFNGGNLRDSLDLLGYDIIYIDFENGVDSLENNSALTQAAITWVNNNKTTSAQNVVMGLSMGAVIARHALRTMEINSIPHDTRLYVSMDGPHQGGNFPLSLQALIRQLNNAELALFWGALPVFKFSDAFEGLDDAKAILEAPASKQLLKYRVSGVPQISNGFNIDNTPHDTFFSNLHNNIGYPSLTRNIAISNGSECGSDQGFAPLTTIYNNVSRTTLPYVFDAATAWYQFIGGIFTNKPLIGLYAPLALISTKSSFDIEFEAKALPDQSTDRIYKGRVGIKRKVLGLFNVNANITNRNLNASSYMLPIDSAPGGRADFANAAGLGVPNDFAALVEVGGFGYIPTVSALDIGSGITPLSSVQLYSAYSITNPPVSPNNSPFASFVTAVSRNNGANSNEDHVTFTPRNGAFLLKELSSNTNTPVNCAQFCSPTSLISGSTQLCDISQNYNISNLPTGATVTWSILPATGRATLTTSGNTATLTKTGNGNVQLFATVNSICGVININPLNIYAGIPQISAINLSTISASGYWCANSRGNYFDIEMEPGQSPNGLTFQVQLLDPVTYQVFANYTVSGGSGTFALSRPPYTTYLLQARVVNHPCGTSENWFGYEMEFVDCSNNYRVSNYNVYPNPASNDLTIEYNPVEETSIEKTTISNKQKEVQLFNNKGEIIVSSMMKENEVKLTLDTKNIPNGTYFLHITEGKETIKKQIIIKH
jgi:hypothetical protein